MPPRPHPQIGWTHEHVARARVVVAEHGLVAAAKLLSAEWGCHVGARGLASRMRRTPPLPPDDVEVLGEADLAPDDAPPAVDTLPAAAEDEVSAGPREPVRAPAVHTSKTRGESYLVIPDLQIPFEAEHALRFCIEVAREYDVSPDNVLCVGDEIDQNFGSMYASDPDATHTANSEIRASIDRLKQWYRAFPFVRVCNSNHGDRWLRKASNAQIPSQLLRAYREIIEAPEGWRWSDVWRIPASKHPFLMEHGHRGAGGIHAHRQKAIDNGISTVHGHLHASAAIAYVRTQNQKLWGFNCGSLIDVEAYAFKYNSRDRYKPGLGCGVILDGGRRPLWVPYE